MEPGSEHTQGLAYPNPLKAYKEILQEYLPERHIPGTPDIGPETRPATCHIPFGYGPHR